MEGEAGQLVMMTFDAILRVIYFKGLYGRQRKVKVELLFDHPHRNCRRVRQKNKFENN